ncbi:UPF0149 family protein [Brumicola pallidula]|uniref:YecA family protein n=1 Tax=Brumicola pallidula DSM 14239 = ACAM 615 TaxID=1121922 RepID=K6Z166_9ALTE|nr:UPF0149 family protein [Glaciecola pallidula]GAC29926.1 hypothetical protein GPAL_3075 [Glaciecola pallidula DSM 14239 = ACAM 615]
MNLLLIYQNSDIANILHSRYYVEGMIFGAGVSPEIPMPDVWLPWAIKHHGQMQNNQQADVITDALFDYFKYCLQQMKDNAQCIPSYGVFADDSDKWGKSSPLSQWLQGLLTAHSTMESVWQNAWQSMQDKNPKNAPVLAKKLKHSLGMFSTFADVELAIEQAKKRGQTDFDNKLSLIVQSLPDAFNTYVLISGVLASYLPNQFENFVQKPI